MICEKAGVHTYENTGSASGRRLFGSGTNHRRTSSNVSNSSVTGIIMNSSNVNPSFRLEDELDLQPSSQAVTVSQGNRVAFDLEPRAPASSGSYRMARQNSLEMERPGTLVFTCNACKFKNLNA